MKAQSLVQRTLGSPGAMDTIAAILAGEQFASRRAVARRVCEEFGFRDRLGRLQVATCLKALNVLAERSERIVLPTPAAVVSGGGKPSLLAAGASLAESVPERLQGVEKLCVLRVRKRSQRQIWNMLIANEHRLGMTTFAGAQMRYLVHSAHGWLGALGFAAAVLRLAARERWMGWSDDQRRAHLNRVVGLSRFLIRGGCAHLASHVLGQVLRRLPGDFLERYGYRPWVVETFVAQDQRGTSLQAANFLRIGATVGRKWVYVYELDAARRRQSRGPPPSGSQQHAARGHAPWEAEKPGPYRKCPERLLQEDPERLLQEEEGAQRRAA